MNRGRKGFTLVELLVVIAIIAILAAVAVPTALGIVKKGHQSNYTALRDGLVSHIKGAAPLSGYIDADSAVDACKLDKKNEYIEKIVVTTDENNVTTFTFTMIDGAKYTPKESEKTVTIHNMQILPTDKVLTLTKDTDFTFTGVIEDATP